MKPFCARGTKSFNFRSRNSIDGNSTMDRLRHCSGGRQVMGLDIAPCLLFFFFFQEMYSSILSIQKTPTYNRSTTNQNKSLESPKSTSYRTKKAFSNVCDHMTKSKEQSASAAAYIYALAYIYLVLLLPGRHWCFLLLRDQHDSGPVFLRSKIFRPAPLEVTEDRHFQLVIRLRAVSRCR